MPALGPAPAQALVTARFNPLIRPYLVLQVAAILAASVIGLPLAVLWVLGVGQWWARHYFDKLECHLDDRKLRFKRGILVTVDKTIPLENIQDVTFVEGPILRRFNLATLKFETGGSGAPQFLTPGRERLGIADGGGAMPPAAHLAEPPGRVLAPRQGGRAEV